MPYAASSRSYRRRRGASYRLGRPGWLVAPAAPQPAEEPGEAADAEEEDRVADDAQPAEALDEGLLQELGAQALPERCRDKARVIFLAAPIVYLFTGIAPDPERMLRHFTAMGG